MSIRKKIIAGLVSTLILFLSITVFHYYHFYSAKEQLNLIHGVYFPFSKGLIRLHLSFLGINDRLKKSLTVVEGKGIHTEQASSKNANHAYVFAIKKK